MQAEEPPKAPDVIDPIWRSRKGCSAISAPAQAGLYRGQVQVWCADLDVSTEVIVKLWQTLSPDEAERAKRFCFEGDRSRFVAARGILRSILSRYVCVAPPQIQFSYSPRGKPFLDAPAEICFNLSHSQKWALYAVGCDRVGIDLEYIRPVETLKLAKRFFSGREYAALSALPADQQQTAFFQVWTGKEAYLKATGDGLINLERVEMTIGSAPMRLISGGDGNADRWLLQPISLTASYAATLAFETQAIESETNETQANITYWQWAEI